MQALPPQAVLDSESPEESTIPAWKFGTRKGRTVIDLPVGAIRGVV